MREGALWETKPQIHASGLICALHISKFGVTNKHLQPEQRCRATALCYGKNTCVLVDSSSNVYQLDVRANKWLRVGRGSSTGTAVDINPRRSNEIAAGFTDGSVICLDSRTLTRIATLSDHKLPVHSVTFHRDGAPVSYTHLTLPTIYSV